MDVVILFNGLGNQMSQYAFYLRKKSINSSTRVLFDKGANNNGPSFQLNSAFNIVLPQRFIDACMHLIFKILVTPKYPIIIKPVTKALNILGFRVIREALNYDYDEANLSSLKGVNFYWGGWHCDKYYLPVKENMLQEFTFRLDEIKSNTNLTKIIEEIHATNSVSIHVRRGDFLTSNGYYNFALVATLDYYQKAIDLISTTIAQPHFFVFSNDLEWCRNNLVLNSVTFVDINNGIDAWKDLFLISLCKHNINANSTFSWWGAWLNTNKNKLVIVPEFFIKNVITKDVYPDSWIRIKTN